MRKLFFNLHLYVGLIAGVLVILFGITGAIMAFEPEIDRLLHWKLSYVTPQDRTLSLAEIGAAVSKAFPGERIASYGVATSPDLSDQVMLPRKVVYVNPYTGEILGTQTGPDGVAKFLRTVHQLHLRLLIQDQGDHGKRIMSWAGTAMLFLLLSGLYLWWRYKRFTVKWSGTDFRKWFDLHAALGVFSFLFLLVLALTGVMIGFEETTTPLAYQITGSHPSPRPNTKVEPPPNARPISPDEAMAVARAALPGAAPFLIQIPGPKGAYAIRARYPEDRTPGGRSFVFVDQYSGKVLFAEGSRTAPGGARIVIANRAIHTGDIFGIPSKALVSLVSLMSVVQVVSGVAMWWKKRKKAAEHANIG